MKEIKTETTIYNIEYEAADGTRFTNKEACIKYDQTVAGVLRGYLKEMSLVVATEEELLHTGSCETTLFTVVPKTQTDIDHIKQFAFACGCGDRSFMSLLTSDVINKVVLVYVGIDNDWVYVDTLDRLVERITDNKCHVKWLE